MSETTKNEILWQNEILLFANKPEGIPVHETKDPKRKDFTRYLQEKYSLAYLRTVNRLDLGTSGIVMFSKDPSQNVFVDACLQAAKKKYIFIASGHPEWTERTEKIHLKETQKKMKLVHSGGKQAITHFKVLYQENEDLFLGGAELVTGRRHQIRITLAHLGHPILGDPLYGDTKQSEKRIYLHSYSFSSEFNGESLHILCPIPSSFQERIKIPESLNTE
ncbi:pseudouridine synthase [Leptospira ryugenii]|uniref:Pseudouridine synthase n=1 Tax=Leptospira ryugenii TaxID=1917863 RepID=A0A2P2DVQ7_9LEPT|nr:RluA family pseudouridine synthase [Leptospira ryugenii]GBF48721.1 pseudouridine synthase [Leptospira ryugenii]